MLQQKGATSLALGALLLLPACGGGLPLLHPAHTLRQGHVSGAVGASGHFVLGDPDQAVTDADAAGPNGIDQESANRTAKGLAASVIGAEGVAPHVGARVGVAPTTEAGLAYSGRSVRLDGRHAFENKKYALSLGLGLHALLTHPASSSKEPPSTVGVDASGLKGYGVDLPVIVGYRSDADLVQLWAGLRGGYEHVFGDVYYSEGTDQVTASVTGDGYSAGALLGLAVGLSPIWVAAEISAGYLHASGKYDRDFAAGGKADVDGVTVTPAGALIGRF